MPTIAMKMFAASIWVYNWFFLKQCRVVMSIHSQLLVYMKLLKTPCKHSTYKGHQIIPEYILYEAPPQDIKAGVLCAVNATKIGVILSDTVNLQR
jgi:hypothetical protein